MKTDKYIIRTKETQHRQIMSENKNIKISDLVLNTGQIEGLPKNPRFIRNERFESLKKSIQDAPEMLDYRRLAVYPFNGKYVILCGNMRYRACKELGYKEMPCYVLPMETPAKVLREWVVKDNMAFGEIDTELLTEWDATELQEWGMELPEWNQNEGIEDIKEIQTINEECTLKVVCRDIHELEALQKRLKIQGKKITYEKLMAKI